MPGTDWSSAGLALFRSTGDAGAVLPPFLAVDALVLLVAFVAWALPMPGAEISKTVIDRYNENVLMVRIENHLNTAPTGCRQFGKPRSCSKYALSVPLDAPALPTCGLQRILPPYTL